MPDPNSFLQDKPEEAEQGQEWELALVPGKQAPHRLVVAQDPVPESVLVSVPELCSVEEQELSLVFPAARKALLIRNQDCFLPEVSCQLPVYPDSLPFRRASQWLWLLPSEAFLLFSSLLKELLYQPKKM